MLTEVMHRRLEPIAAGIAAPDFALRHTPTQSTSLRSLRGRPAVLVFYPADWEPVSSEQLGLYQEYLVPNHHGASLLGISPDQIWSHQAFARALGLHFPLLSDTGPRGSVSRRYGVYREDEELSARAIFVIDHHGIIRFSHAYPDILNPGIDDILTTLERMQEPGTSAL